MKCSFCQGDGYAPSTAYTKSGWACGLRCVRCDGSGAEPQLPLIHPALVLRNRRSGKVWAVFASYHNQNGRNWGIHRMIPSRSGAGHYVWQILIRPEHELLDTKRWTPVGFGDAWDHTLMESDPV